MQERDSKIAKEGEGGQYCMLELMLLGERAEQYWINYQKGIKLGSEERDVLERMDRFFKSALAGSETAMTGQLTATSGRDLQALRWSRAIEATRAKENKNQPRKVTEILPQYRSAVQLLLEGRRIDAALAGEIREFFACMNNEARKIMAGPTATGGSFESSSVSQREEEWLNKMIFGIKRPF